MLAILRVLKPVRMIPGLDPALQRFWRRCSNLERDDQLVLLPFVVTASAVISLVLILGRSYHVLILLVIAAGWSQAPLITPSRKRSWHKPPRRSFRMMRILTTSMTRLRLKRS